MPEYTPPAGNNILLEFREYVVPIGNNVMLQFGSLEHSVLIEDAGAGAEVVDVQMTHQAITVPDTGAGVDIISGKGLFLSDTGAGADVVEVPLVGLTIEETGSARDYIGLEGDYVSTLRILLPMNKTLEVTSKIRRYEL